MLTVLIFNLQMFRVGWFFLGHVAEKCVSWGKSKLLFSPNQQLKPCVLSGLPLRLRDDMLERETENNFTPCRQNSGLCRYHCHPTQTGQHAGGLWVSHTQWPSWQLDKCLFIIGFEETDTPRCGFLCIFPAWCLLKFMDFKLVVFTLLGNFIFFVLFIFFFLSGSSITGMF